MGDVQVTIRLPNDLLARVDRLVSSAAGSGNPLITRLSRSQMLRAVVELGIDIAERQYAPLLRATGASTPKRAASSRKPQR